MEGNYYIYALYSKDFNKIYVWMTSNIDQRINEHNQGKSKYTKSYMPWEIVFTISVGSRKEARKLEKYYKSYRGRQKVWLEVNKKFGIKQ